MVRPDIADALAAATRIINSPFNLDETLVAIVDTAKDTVPGIDHVGISIAHKDGAMQTRAATDDLVWRLDALQYEAGEGPCVYAMRGHGVVHVNHAAHEQRWAGYIPRAVKEGLRSQIGIQLFSNDLTLGGLNLYSTSTDVLPEDSSHIATLFATHAAVAFRRAAREHNLNEAVETRQLIGQAVRIVMERYELNETRAFEFLTRASQSHNIKLRDIASDLVQNANDGDKLGTFI